MLCEGTLELSEVDFKILKVGWMMLVRAPTSGSSFIPTLMPYDTSHDVNSSAFTGVK